MVGGGFGQGRRWVLGKGGRRRQLWRPYYLATPPKKLAPKISQNSLYSEEVIEILRSPTLNQIPKKECGNIKGTTPLKKITMRWAFLACIVWIKKSFNQKARSWDKVQIFVDMDCNGSLEGVK